MTSYCEYLRDHPEDTLNNLYHDSEYGFPLESDAALLERFALEINQAGLSWTLMLKRKDNFHRAFDGFDVDTVAAYGEEDVARLLADAGIIRNRLKVSAVIENARRIQGLRGEYGSLQELAGRAPSTQPGGMDEPVQENLRLHRRGNRQGTPASAAVTCRAPMTRIARSISRSPNCSLPG